jgi:integrase
MDQTDLLFPSPEVDGQPLSYNTVFGVYKRCLAFLELPPVTLHSLRHTFASTMLAAGVPITTLARNLGHATPDITLRIYSHEIFEGLGESLERAEKLFGGPGLEEKGDE